VRLNWGGQDLGVVKDYLQGAVVALWRSPGRQVDGEVELGRTGPWSREGPPPGCGRRSVEIPGEAGRR